MNPGMSQRPPTDSCLRDEFSSTYMDERADRYLASTFDTYRTFSGIIPGVVNDKGELIAVPSVVRDPFLFNGVKAPEHDCIAADLKAVKTPASDDVCVRVRPRAEPALGFFIGAEYLDDGRSDPTYELVHDFMSALSLFTTSDGKPNSAFSSIPDSGFIGPLLNLILGSVRWAHMMQQISNYARVHALADHIPPGYVTLKYPASFPLDPEKPWDHRKESMRVGPIASANGQFVFFSVEMTSEPQKYVHPEVLPWNAVAALASLMVPTPGGPSFTHSADSYVEAVALNHDISVLRTAAKTVNKLYLDGRTGRPHPLSKQSSARKIEKLMEVWDAYQAIFPMRSRYAGNIKETAKWDDLEHNAFWKPRQFVDLASLNISQGQVVPHGLDPLLYSLTDVDRMPWGTYRTVTPMYERLITPWGYDGGSEWLLLHDLEDILHSYLSSSCSAMDHCLEVLVNPRDRDNLPTEVFRSRPDHTLPPLGGQPSLPEAYTASPYVEMYALYNLSLARYKVIDLITTCMSEKTRDMITKAYHNAIMDLKHPRRSTTFVLRSRFSIEFKDGDIDADQETPDVPELKDGVAQPQHLTVHCVSPDKYVAHPREVVRKSMKPIGVLPLLPRNTACVISRFAPRDEDWPANQDVRMNGALSENVLGDTSGCHKYNLYSLGVMVVRKHPVEFVEPSQVITFTINPTADSHELL
jgi:hypothetical protein